MKKIISIIKKILQSTLFKIIFSSLFVAVTIISPVLLVFDMYKFGDYIGYGLFSSSGALLFLGVFSQKTITFSCCVLFSIIMFALMMWAFVYSIMKKRWFFFFCVCLVDFFILSFVLFLLATRDDGTFEFFDCINTRLIVSASFLLVLYLSIRNENAKKTDATIFIGVSVAGLIVALICINRIEIHNFISNYLIGEFPM